MVAIFAIRSIYLLIYSFVCLFTKALARKRRVVRNGEHLPRFPDSGRAALLWSVRSRESAGVFHWEPFPRAKHDKGGVRPVQCPHHHCPHQPSHRHDERHVPAASRAVGRGVEVWARQADSKHGTRNVKSHAHQRLFQAYPRLQDAVQNAVPVPQHRDRF